MRKELEVLRKQMKMNHIDVYIAKDADDHISEFNDPYYSAMEFISGFTGGDGTLVVTESDARLWTDGRYFIQAENELKNTGITLMKEGEPGVTEMEEWIREEIPDHGTLGFDGRCISCEYAETLIGRLESKNVNVTADRDIVDEIWTDRPEKNACLIRILENRYAGKTVQEKFAEIGKYMNERNCSAHVMSAMDDIAWTLNLRGNDVPYSPVFDSFLLIRENTRTLYVSEAHLSDEISNYLKDNGISIAFDTEEIYRDLSELDSGTVLIDPQMTSYRMVHSLPADVKVKFDTEPAYIFKCRKNKTEQENLEKAQLKDCIAVTRFMCWFKKCCREHIQITELSAADKLHQFRMEQPGFLGESFETISAYGPNAAMCHYVTDPEMDVEILFNGLYLVDSGGHYPEGSTDITRTWACGPVNEKKKRAYTLTAVANLRLASQIFPDQTSGLTLDLAAREIFWKNGLDYNHGTGHGVGYLLNVHEGPACIRFKCARDSYQNVMTEGVYVSDEPGLYMEGEFGVRLENMELVTEAFRNEFRRFMKFKTLTFVPFDRDCMDRNLMTEEDVKRYNEYHKRVFDTISAYLNNEEREWLKEACRPL